MITEPFESYPIHNTFWDQSGDPTRIHAFIVPNKHFLFVSNDLPRAPLTTDRGLPVPTYLNWFEQNVETGRVTAFYHGSVVVVASLSRGFAISSRPGDYESGQQIVKDGPDLVRFLQKNGIDPQDASIIWRFGAVRKPDPFWVQVLRMSPFRNLVENRKPQYYPWKAWKGNYHPPSPFS